MFRIIDNLNLEEEWSVQSWESYTDDRREPSNNNVGLIVAVSILGALLIIACVAALIGFYFVVLR